MVIHEFRCPQHGVFERMLPLDAPSSQTSCPQCGADALRQMAAPRVLRSSRSQWTQAVERAQKSRHEPEVVTSVPASGARRRIRQVPMTPALQRLPRP